MLEERTRETCEGLERINSSDLPKLFEGGFMDWGSSSMIDLMVVGREQVRFTFEKLCLL